MPLAALFFDSHSNLIWHKLRKMFLPFPWTKLPNWSPALILYGIFCELVKISEGLQQGSHLQC